MNLNQSSAHVLRVYRLETWYEWVKTWRTPAFVIPSLLFPVMFYVFFGLIFNRSGLDGQMSTYMLATYGVFGVIGPALFSFGVGVALEKQQGWLALKQISPMPIGAYFFAKIATSMLFGLVILLQIFVLGALFGNIVMTYLQWFSSLVVILLGSLPFCAIGLWLGLLLSGQSAPAVVNLVYLPMSFLSGLWIPINFFPGIMENIAFAMPPFHLAQLALKIQGNDLGYTWWIHVAYLVVISGVFLFLALNAFRRSAEVA